MLTTLDTVKEELDADDSSDLSIKRKIRVYSDLFRSVADRNFSFESSKTIRVRQPAGRRFLRVHETPLHEVESVRLHSKQGVKEFDADEYFIDDPSTGLIARYHGTWQATSASQGNIRRKPTSQPISTYEIVADVGYVTPKQAQDEQLTRDLPYDIEEAIVLAVVSGITQQGVDSAITQISVGDGSTTLDSAGDTPRQVPQFFMDVAKKYKTVEVL